MTFELLRQMVRAYGPDKAFESIREGRMALELPGVVLIDEIDAHLHPSWQRRVGDWLCRYFPKIQFIVTTHSPLICHAAETGSVWRLPAPGSDAPQGRVRGTDLNRLVFGSVLDAFDTELFGRGVARSESSCQMLERLAYLNVQSLKGKLSKREHAELQRLRAALPTAVGAGSERTGGAR